MKNKILLLTTALLITVSAIAQKDEMKTLKKIYDKDAPSDKDILDFKEAISKAEPQMTAATDADRVYFNYFKSNVPFMEMMVAMQKPDGMTNIAALAQKYFNAKNISELLSNSTAVFDFEKKSGKEVYTKDIKEGMTQFKPMIVNYIDGLGKNSMYKDGAIILKSLYDFDKKDSEKLYFAANYAMLAKDYPLALQNFKELKSINYSGEGTNYYAKSAVTDSEDYFGNDDAAKKDRDNRVNLTLYKSPRDEKVASKKPEILKNIALITNEIGANDEIKTAYEDAIAANPDDLSLLTELANFYYFKLKDEASYKKYVSMAVDKNPNDPTLNYNLGVVSMKANNDAEAEKYFKKTIELKPDYADAYLNLAQLKINVQQKYATEMAKLSTNEKDTKRYNFLNIESKKLVNEALPNLEKAYELSENKADVGAQLVSVYKYLDMMDKAKALKAKL